MRILVLLLLIAACVFPASPSAPEIPRYTFRIVHAYPHDPQAFTQGLEFHRGFLYEGTGLEGHSTLRREQLESAKVLQQISLAAQYFGEGITVLHNRIVQLTWQAHLGYIYDQASFHSLKTFSYPGEGWGLANDGHLVYMSDGTARIRVLNPNTLVEERRFTVHDGSGTIDRLNELEWVEGELYANIWQANRIARVSPVDGRVLGWIDLTGLLPPSDQTAETDVLNGIAYDAARRRLFVTGKRWPKLFEIELVPAQ